MPEKMPEKNPEKEEKREKIVLGIIVFLGIFALILGFLQFSRNLEPSFAKKSADKKTSADSQQSELENIAELQTKDTDKDGLTDYQELYIYNTSPYLEDTDSDGILDKKEIDSGTDPNCPQGKTCKEASIEGENLGASIPDNPSIPASPSLLPNNTFDIGGLGNLGGLGGTDISSFKSSLQDLSADQIRALLKGQGGLTDEQLSQIDDETLKKLYQETLDKIK